VGARFEATFPPQARDANEKNRLEVHGSAIRRPLLGTCSKLRKAEGAVQERSSVESND